MTMTNRPSIELGTRIAYTWTKPYRGDTPGIIAGIKKTRKGTTVTVQWDDGTVTSSSVEFIEKQTKEFLGWG